MTDKPQKRMSEKDQQAALFWCSLLRPLLFKKIEEKEANQYLQEIAKEEILFPNGERKRPDLSTLRRKLKLFTEGGFEALARKPRSDRGKPRVHSQEVIAMAIDIKRDLSTRSNVTINKFLEAKHKTTVPKSTLYRHLKQAGATRIKLGVDKKPVRKRWTRDHTHALWIGDFEHGPYVLHQGQVVPSHLSAFIDCHSRYLIEGRYYYKENLDILIDSLLRAFQKHGAPNELYVDHAKIYQSRALKSACASLKIDLFHRGKGDPPPGGLIERFFKTVQDQFEAEVRRDEMFTLEELNKAFLAWLSQSYHREKNDETKQTPKDRYNEGLTVIKQVDLQKVLYYFMSREIRTVNGVFSDVQLHNRFYRVDKKYRKDKVEVWYDPYSHMDIVLIYSLDGKYLGEGKRHHREKREDPTPAPRGRKLKYNYLKLLRQKHEEELRRQTQGIDYRRAVTERGWPFLSFAVTLAQLLGRKGDLTSFSQRELELLRKIYNQMPHITQPLLMDAVEAAEEKTFVHIYFQLQRLSHRKE